MMRLRLFNMAKVTPAAIAPLVILAWLRPQLEPTGSSQAIDDAVTTSLWWVAAGIALWMAISVIVWGFCDTATTEGRASWLDRLTAPGSKRLARVMLASAAFAVSACSDGTGAPVLRAVDTIAVEDAAFAESVDQEQPSTTSTDAMPASVADPTPDPPVADRTLLADEPLIEEPPPLEVGIEPHPLAKDEGSPAQADSDHLVATGDSLWSIAQAHIIRHDPDATKSDVAIYWRELISANAGSLRSGEPNLIYVGETLTLPAISAG